MGNCCSNKVDLTKVTWKNTRKFVPPIEKAYVIKVYDGDTITIATTFPWEPTVVYRFPVRILGIDTPEMKTKDEDEKYVAKLAKEFVTKMVLNKYVILENVSTDKYGRLLANVYTSKKKISIGQKLINNKLAVLYDGGTKKCPDNWRKYYEK